MLNIIKKYSLCTAVDIGAGDRFFTSQLASFVSGAIYAVDTGYDEKENSLDGIHCFNNISELPEFCNGGIILMDVLEHIHDDTSFLKEILEKMPASSFVFITVPAFQFLFSGHDVFLKHYRRYNRMQLLALIKAVNLRVEKCHYFYSSLFFARMISLFIRKDKQKRPGGIGEWRFGEKHIITRIISAILNIDFHICAFFANFHIYLPGLSILAVCKNQKGSFSENSIG